jgi:RNA polymerase sigma-70 factor (ECF subfamily)
VSEREADLLLVRRVQKGDKAAFDLLVLKYQHKVAKLLTRFVYGRVEVEDVAQEAFIKAYRAIGGFRGDSAFYTWLYRIAVNTAKNHLVSQGRGPVTVDADLVDMENLDEAAKLREISTPENAVLTQEIASVVQRTIDALPEDLRTAISLREFDGLSYDDIAQVMECPIGTVRSRIFRAREAIDEQILPLLER